METFFGGVRVSMLLRPGFLGIYAVVFVGGFWGL